MYTQCPKCQVAFRVTATVLQKAQGRVRCGGCGNAFSAIQFLSEDLPVNADAKSHAPGTAAPDAGVPEKKSKELLDALDELAGKEQVRIEDTGVEWRVLEKEDTAEGESETLDDLNDTGSMRWLAENSASDDDDLVKESVVIEQLDDADESPTFERRYDDNTPLPEDFDDEDDIPFSASSSSPKRRSTDAKTPAVAFEAQQIDLGLDGDEDWGELLDEDEKADAVDDMKQQLATAEAKQLADDSALLPELAADIADNAEPADATPNEVPADITSQFNLQAEALGLDITQNVPLSESEDEILEVDDGAAELDGDDERDEVAEEVIDGSPDKPVDEDLDEDELSAEEEADIVEKLRESTGAFRKQIEAAQQALNRGDIDEFTDEMDGAAADDEALDSDLEAIDDDTADSDEAQEEFELEDAAELELAADAELESDDEVVVKDDVELNAEERLSQTMIQAGIDPSHLQSDNVETIIMEGDFVRGSVEDDSVNIEIENEAITQLDEASSLVDTYMLNKSKMRGGRRKTDPVGGGIITGVVFLAIILIAQYIHASRESLAAYGAFNQTVGHVYRALGKPITPEWDVKGWRFESTRGNTNDLGSILTISSQINNASNRPLPYPLIHVSLTDRWEETIGSKVLEPSEYLAGDRDPRKPVIPGDPFTAVIVVEAPSEEATGFKLNVCYRTSPGQVRCATEDFKD